MSSLSRRGFFITVGVSAATMRVLKAQNGGENDAILRALVDELERSRQLRIAGGGGDDLPYFISYTLDDTEEFSASATLGALLNRGESRYRIPLIEVRVGSPDFDNTGHIFSGRYTGSRFDNEGWPLDDNYQNMRDVLWLATDHAYKAAVESIARKRAALTSAAAQPDKLPDFTKGDPITSLAPRSTSKVDTAAWTNRVVKLSSIFGSYPEVLTSSVEFQSNQGTTYYVNSEGTRIRYPDNVAWVTVRAIAQAADGMVIRDALSIPALELNQFPPDADLEQGITDIAKNIRARVKAPVGEAFSGPVLFEPPAAAQLFAQLLGDNFRVPRKPVSDPNRPVNFVPSEFEGRIGSRVLPDWLDVVDDPTQRTWQGKPLAGYYPFDIEGTKPQTVSLIEKGVLKTFLTTRQPVKGVAGSNGHARLPANFGARGSAISNLFIKASGTQPVADLRAKLIQLCKDRDKPFGLVIRRLDFPFSGDGRELQSLMAASSQSGGSVRSVSPPVLIYRVYPDGREELVRGLRFRGLSTRSLRDIMAGSSETALFQYINNAAPLALLGAGGILAPSAVISPGLLFEELDLEPSQEQLERLPIVPPPNSSSAKA